MIIKHINSELTNDLSNTISFDALIQNKNVKFAYKQSSTKELERMVFLMKRRVLLNVNVAILTDESNYAVYRLHITTKVAKSLTGDIKKDMVLILAKSNKISKLKSVSITKLKTPMLIRDIDSDKFFPCSLIVS